MKSSYSGFPEGLPIMLEPSGPNFAPHPIAPHPRQTMTVAQDASAIFDSASAQASTAADGTVIISDIQTFENPHVYGIAQMAATGLSIWRNEINDMNKRLGELRDSSAQSNGVWARVYNGKAKYGSQSVTNKYTAFQFGYDRQVVPGVWLGGAFSYTDGDNDFSDWKDWPFEE